MFTALKEHWPEYLMEAAGLGIFRISACVFDALLEYPVSPVHQPIRDPLVRRILMGLAMGLTAVGLIYSPWGKQSGAHLNPAVTLTFYGLGKVAAWEACFYTVAQFLGGLAGVLLAAALLGQWVADPAVNYAVTVPGPAGQAVAFLAEFLISFGLMMQVLITSNTDRAARFTGLLAGAPIALYIAVEAPYSGMSMNPARTLASAVPAQVLGLKVAGRSENFGTEQEHLANVFGVRVRITGLRPAAGPGIELLEYLTPRDGRNIPKDERANDLVHAQTRLVVRDADETARSLLSGKYALVSPGVVRVPQGKFGFTKGFLVRDPDGHVLQLVETEKGGKGKP